MRRFTAEEVIVLARFCLNVSKDSLNGVFLVEGIGLAWGVHTRSFLKGYPVSQKMSSGFCKKNRRD